MKVQLLLALYTEDFEMCFQDYMKALEIMEGLVESDHRGIAEMYPYCLVEFSLFTLLNFWLSLLL